MKTIIPRAVAAMGLDMTAELQKVELARRLLEKDARLTPRQSRAISKVVLLLGEAARSGGGRRRGRGGKDAGSGRRTERSLARELLLEIHQRLGVDVLLLCSIALSITKLSEVRRHHDGVFFVALGQWRASVDIGGATGVLATDAFAAVLPSQDQQQEQAGRGESQAADHDSADGKGEQSPPMAKKKGATAAKRKRADSGDEATAIPGCTEWAIGDPATPVGGCVLVDRGSDTHSTTEDNQSSNDKSETSPAPASTADVATEEHLPLYAKVIKLNAMDMIRAIALQDEVEARLTIPDVEGSKPFITVHCPRWLALEFKASREHVQW